MITVKKKFVTIIYRILTFLFLQCIMMHILNIENTIRN